MTMRELAQDTLDTAYAELGEPATYHPFEGGVHGAGIPVTVMPIRRDAIEQLYEQQRVKAETSFKLRASEVARPVLGGHIVTAADTWKIAGEPRRDDRLGLEWTLDCSRARPK